VRGEGRRGGGGRRHDVEPRAREGRSGVP